MVYRGLYHVLLEESAPLERNRAGTTDVGALVQRVSQREFREIIMATNPTLEGDGTALHISNLLAECAAPITRLARGITTGSVLEFANKESWPTRLPVGRSLRYPLPCDFHSAKSYVSFKSRCWRRG